MVNSQARIVINGVSVPGAEVDTDPFVYGVGAQLATGGVVTAVLPRAELKSIQLQFTTRVKGPQRPYFDPVPGGCGSYPPVKWRNFTRKTS